MVKWLINESLPELLRELSGTYSSPQLATLANDLKTCQLDKYADTVNGVQEYGVPEAIVPFLKEILYKLLNDKSRMIFGVHNLVLAVAGTAACQNYMRVSCLGVELAADYYLKAAAEQAVQVLIDLKTPGSELLGLL